MGLIRTPIENSTHNTYIFDERKLAISIMGTRHLMNQFEKWKMIHNHQQHHFVCCFYFSELLNSKQIFSIVIGITFYSTLPIEIYRCRVGQWSVFPPWAHEKCAIVDPQQKKSLLPWILHTFVHFETPIKRFIHSSILLP